jgi:lysophospholipase L1-like esterase
VARRKAALSIGIVLALLSSAPAATAGPLVALGDSYSSGEGAPPFMTGTAKPGVNTCHRSQRSWPEIVGTATQRRVTSLACSGAEIEDVLRSDPDRAEQERRTSQIKRLRSTRPELVTLTIGGNDIGFVDVLRKCVTALRRCDKIYREDGRDELEQRISDLEERLPNVYRQVRAAGSAARLVVVGYPRIFPSRPALITCTWMASAELRYLNEKAASLNAAIRRAAARVHVAYIDVSDALEKHELSCRSGSWVNPLRPTPVRLPYSFHPTADGQTALAEVVEGGLRRLGLGRRVRSPRAATTALRGQARN